MTEIRRQLAALPSPDDKIILFDRYRSEVRSFAETLDAASDEKVRELVALLVERVETADRQVARVVWTAPARPFFAGMALLGGAPPDGLGGSRTPTARHARVVRGRRVRPSRGDGADRSLPSGAG